MIFTLPNTHISFQLFSATLIHIYFLFTTNKICMGLVQYLAA